MSNKCSYCGSTGYIHTEDDIPDQMCPNCVIGQAVIEGYNHAREIGIQACDTLEAAKDERIEELEELLIEYGNHKEGCIANTVGNHCNCGFEQALKAK